MSNILTTPPIDYYEDINENWGGYQYVTIKDVVNRFMLTYVGDDRILPSSTKRYQVIYHAKRALQELNYDALKEIKAMELELGDSLQITLPIDYVNYVRVSYVDQNGRFHPIMQNNDTTIITASYLQDNKYKILFDQAGYPLEGESVTFTNAKNSDIGNVNTYDIAEAWLSDSSTISGDVGGPNYGGANYGLDASKANKNGTFNIDKKNGLIQFSSDLKSRIIVLEYISDGLEYSDESEIEVHKMAEACLINYIAWQMLHTKYNVQEYVVNRFRKEYFSQLNNTKLRMADIDGEKIIQILKGRRTWLG